MRTETVLNTLQKRLKISVEVKKVTSRRSTHLVPFPVKSRRKVYLITKWIYNGSKKLKKMKKFKNTTSKALELEIMNTIFKKSNSYKFKKYSIRNAIQNRANAHFRW